jgi:fatty-acyl-CoA synthase
VWHLQTLIEALAFASRQTERGHTFVRADGTERHVPFQQLFQEVREVAGGLKQMGLKRGERLALVVPDPEQFVVTFLGAMAGGFVPVPVYPPASMTKLESYGTTLGHILKAAGAKVLIAPRAQREMLTGLIAQACPEVQTLDAEDVPRGVAMDEAVRPDEIALLQFTSGSTSAPKGVTITHGQLAANCKAIMVDGLKSNGDVDRGVSWLPMYHDMGLIGFVCAPLFTEVPVVFLPTTAFVRRPSIWLQTIHKYRGTITFAPNFAFALATRSIQDRHMEGWDLSCLRVLGCGAEPIQPEVMRSFCDKFARVGFNQRSLMPAYGMAEATLAISFATLDRPLLTERVDATALSRGRAVLATNGHNAVELVGCGRPLAGMEVAVRDELGQPVADRCVGEVFVRGPSVARDYFGMPEVSAATFMEGGWLRTGDLGYTHQGEVYISGRKKDVLIIHGRNYYPQDMEALAVQVDGLRDAQAAVFTKPFGSNGQQRLVMVAETSRLVSQHESIKQALKKIVYEQVGLVLDEIVLIRRGTLPKTSSGKVRRNETRIRWEAGTLELAEMGPVSVSAPSNSTPSASVGVSAQL